MNSNWKNKGDNWELNLANVLILRVTFYESYGWRGSIEGAYNFPSRNSYEKYEDAMFVTEETAKSLLSVATNELGE